MINTFISNNQAEEEDKDEEEKDNVGRLSEEAIASCIWT